MNTLSRALNLTRNMGLRYVLFRAGFMSRQKSGLLKRAFPVDPPPKEFITLEEWKRSTASFFFSAESDIRVPISAHDDLQHQAQRILAGWIPFFSATEIHLGKDYDWVTNPDTGYRYDATKHWTDIRDYSKEAGDIKWVWEKSRFSYLYTLIRYDQHHGGDHSAFVFREMARWIDANPVNRGPNWRCSQEISIRLLNWTFALHYYKDSQHLTEALFQKLMHSIYWQLRHVYSNIHFSRIAVRNNHAITETMTLFLAGILFPHFPEAATWREKGKAWFEEEVAYQVYPDGTFLQFSMNYHRVVVQLLTWGIRLSEANGVLLQPVVYERAKASLHFLHSCMDPQTGSLPNYGANDGALFFPLNDRDFGDYRPQLAALAAVLKVPLFESHYEDASWYGLTPHAGNATQRTGTRSFADGGYYTLREDESFTFIRCGRHKDRPSQADNLHLDIWVGPHNLLRDGGSYKYNTGENDLRYFFGTASHNTVMLGNHDQMQKGGRFIWYYWSQAEEAGWKEGDSYYEFKGRVSAFRQIEKGITHERTIRKFKDALRWEVRDEVQHNTGLPMRQLWHPAPAGHFEVRLTARDDRGLALEPVTEKGWYSPKYGMKEESPALVFTTNTKSIRTLIEIVPNPA